ncbi:3-dehydroquinate synthase [Mucisphaera sp.]|uniref:3-dehydroquinate synthase n=1 Tax=Mucisphaera sp. TaxID=2913024 RepID=UPI003D0C1225
MSCPPEPIPLPPHVHLKLSYQLHHTRHLTSRDNPTLDQTLTDSPHILAIVDDGLAAAQPTFATDLKQKLAAHPGMTGLHILPAGEASKNTPETLHQILDLAIDANLCRHSTLVVAAGGALLDVAGYAAATLHRGLRLVRIPSTTLAQADSGVAVKNAINHRGLKNLLGTFHVPHAVINDPTLLASLKPRDFHAGLSEVIKVALLKDANLFQQVEQLAAEGHITQETTEPLWQRSAHLHARHILTSGDPFETTTARPLDLGHWSAHQLETLSNHRLNHGEAVAIGLALDAHISHQLGWLTEYDLQRISRTLAACQLPTTDPLLAQTDSLLAGLETFRQHLGGQLRIPLLAGIGKPRDAYELTAHTLRNAIDQLTAAEPSHAS